MTKKLLIIIIVIIVVIAVLGYFGYEYWYQGTPQYSFAQMQQAMKNHDTAEFNEYFNTDSVFNNMWPRARSEYATYYAHSESTFQQSIDLATLDNQSSTNKQEFETQIYDYVTGKGGGSESEVKQSFFQQMGSNPSFSVNAGTATFNFIYENYTSQNPQNYPIYKLTVVMQPNGHRWEVTDIQGVEDLFTTTLADTIRLNAIQSVIPGLANAYIIAGQQPYLTNNNWQTVLASYGVQQGATTTFPEDPLSSYGNAYSFAILNGNSLKNFEYVVKANLATVTDMSNPNAWNGLTYGQLLKDLSGGTNMVLGIDCNPPAYCQFYWGNDSTWAQTLKNDTSTTAQ
jgi:hypothetical protein